MVEHAEKTETESRSYLKPKYEVRNKENVYYVDVHMPGVSRDDAKITLEGDRLVIEAPRVPYRRNEWKAIHREIHEEGYKLHLQLNVDIEPDGITAKSNDGILTVMLPVAAKAAQRTIQIS